MFSPTGMLEQDDLEVWARLESNLKGMPPTYRLCYEFGAGEESRGQALPGHDDIAAVRHASLRVLSALGRDPRSIGRRQMIDEVEQLLYHEAHLLDSGLFQRVAGADGAGPSLLGARPRGGAPRPGAGKTNRAGCRFSTKPRRASAFA